MGRTADQHHAVDPEDKPAEVLGALKFNHTFPHGQQGGWLSGRLLLICAI